jgi:cysteine desulfurase
LHGNASSVHRYGRAARAAVDRAREQVAELVNAHPTQVIFTGCGTEASNLAIKGFAALHEPGHLVIGATEHPSVTEPAESLKKNGWRVSVLPVDGQGCLLEAETEALIKLRPQMVSVMWANNETGVIQDIPALAARVRAHGGVMHTDAVQAAGKIEVDFSVSGAHLMSAAQPGPGRHRGIERFGVLQQSSRAEPGVAGDGRRSGAGAERDPGQLRCRQHGKDVDSFIAALTAQLRQLRRMAGRAVG